MLACTKNCVHAVEPVDGRTAASGFAFVAGCGRVIEIKTTAALQKISRRACHVAQLRRGAGEDGVAQQRVAPLNLRVIGKIAVRDERPDA